MLPIRTRPQTTPASGGGGFRVLVVLSFLMLFLAGLNRATGPTRPTARPSIDHPKPKPSAGSAELTRSAATGTQRNAANRSSPATTKRDISAMYRGRGKMPKPEPAGAVLVEWKGRWWSAEVLKSENGKKLIHYTGWGNEWDEWVGPDRIRYDLRESLTIIDLDGQDRVFGNTLDASIRLWWDGAAITNNIEPKALNGRGVNWVTSGEYTTANENGTFETLRGLIAVDQNAWQPNVSSEEMGIVPVPNGMKVEWGGRWWPAEVLKAEGDRYYIRYLGYGSEWDEWVTPGRMTGLTL